MTTDLLLKVDAKDLARVMPFAAEMDVSYYLNAVPPVVAEALVRANMADQLQEIAA